jgi:hypothetical protein
MSPPKSTNRRMTALAVFHALMARMNIRERPWLGEGRSLRDVANDE